LQQFMALNWLTAKSSSTPYSSAIKDISLRSRSYLPSSLFYLATLRLYISSVSCRFKVTVNVNKSNYFYKCAASYCVLSVMLIPCNAPFLFAIFSSNSYSKLSQPLVSASRVYYLPIVYEIRFVIFGTRLLSIKLMC